MKKLVLLFLLLPLFTVAQNSSHPSNLVRLQSPGSVTVSPDGNWVAFTLSETHMDETTSEFRNHIWVASADGEFLRQFTQGEVSAGSPQFTPDSKFLSFIAKRDEESQVYKIPLNGGEAIKVTDSPTGVSSYAWSPDGSKLAYVRMDEESKEDKRKKKAKEDVIIVDKNHRYNRIWVMDAASGASKALYADSIWVGSFDWSPDGSQIVFDHRPSSDLDERDAQDISLVSADSGEVRPLVIWDGSDSSPIFSHDGKHVLMISDGGKPEPIGLSNVYAIQIEGGMPSIQVNLPDQNAYGLVRGPKENQFFVMESYRTKSAIYEFALNSGQFERLNELNGLYSNFAVSSGANTFAYVRQSSSEMPQVYVSSGKRFRPKKITDFNSDFDLSGLAKSEVITWKSSDGMEIEGILTYPANYQEGRKYPFLLMVHGGPGGVYSESFIGMDFYRTQYFADEGFAILRPNPRGSRGYGKEFRYANFQDLGEGDYEDVMTGVDKVIEMGIAHPDSQVMAGWSYGGYMASRIATKTDRFKAIMMGAGLYNLESMFITTDVKEYGQGLMGGWYWDSPELKAVYAKLSPHTMVDQAKTPVLLLHGANDKRVPVSQSEEFYAALKYQGIDTEMVLYPRTGHGPREPKFRVDVPVRMMNWFNKYLGRE